MPLASAVPAGVVILPMAAATWSSNPALGNGGAGLGLDAPGQLGLQHLARRNQLAAAVFWACLRPEQKATMQKSALAERILKSAASGKRDREFLRDAALMGLAA
jgi:hypothetical protein